MSFRYFTKIVQAFPEVESIAREVSSSAIRSEPSIGEHKVFDIIRDENQDFVYEWSSEAVSEAAP